LAVVLGGFMLLFALLTLPMFFFAPFREDMPNQPPKALFLVFILLYPLFGALWSWISGQIFTRIYNLVARRIGGVLLDLAPIEQSSK
jgi:hypothetical protein